MKAGEKITCPSCKEQTILKEKNDMHGWTNLGTILVCALCDAKIGEPAEPNEVKNTTSLKALEELLDHKAEKKIKLEVAPDETHFCKDCAHFIDHPFITRCGFHGRITMPMDDCPQFTPRTLPC